MLFLFFDTRTEQHKEQKVVSKGMQVSVLFFTTDFLRFEVLHEWLRSGVSVGFSVDPGITLLCISTAIFFARMIVLFRCSNAVSTILPNMPPQIRQPQRQRAGKTGQTDLPPAPQQKAKERKQEA